MRWDKEIWSTEIDREEPRHPELMRLLDKDPPYRIEQIQAIRRLRRGSLLQLYF